MADRQMAVEMKPHIYGQGANKTEGKHRLVAAAHINWIVSIRRDSYALTIHLNTVNFYHEEKTALLPLGLPVVPWQEISTKKVKGKPSTLTDV